jgi:hypothetical protein
VPLISLMDSYLSRVLKYVSVLFIVFSLGSTRTQMKEEGNKSLLWHKNCETKGKEIVQHRYQKSTEEVFYQTFNVSYSCVCPTAPQTLCFRSQNKLC